MFEIERNTIWLTRGDTFKAVIEIRDRSGDIYEPEVGDSLKFHLKRHYEDVNCIVEKSIPTDSLMLWLRPEDTQQLPYGTYVFEVELTFNNGDVDTIIGKAPEPKNDAKLILTKEVK